MLTKDGKHKFYKLNNKEIREVKYVETLFLIYESIVKLEKNKGKQIPIKFLEKEVLGSKDNDRLKISKTEFRRHLDILLRAGVVFYPMGGFVERFCVFD